MGRITNSKIPAVMFMGKPSYYEELVGYQLTISCPELPIRTPKR
jgi:hypothetical protein